MSKSEDMARTFNAMHVGASGFVMPNAWDAGSAVILAAAGFPAIATTSAGIAFSLGKPDYDVRDPKLAVTRDQMFSRMREIAEASDLPVNGDLEAGYGDEPEAVAETIRMAIDAGLAGGNIEDKKPYGVGLYDEGLAIDRIRAARAAIDAVGSSFVLRRARTCSRYPGQAPSRPVSVAQTCIEKREPTSSIRLAWPTSRPSRRSCARSMVL
jgi:2-methylisocitrate lyase-like PEP mutase family enzyme